MCSLCGGHAAVHAQRWASLCCLTEGVEYCLADAHVVAPVCTRQTVADGSMTLVKFVLAFRGWTARREQTIGLAPLDLRPRWGRHSLIHHRLNV